jgi:hypothetical protein
MGMSNVEAMFVIQLMSFYYHKDTRVYPKRLTLADRLGLQKKQIKRITDSLVKKKKLSVRALYTDRGDIGSLSYDFSTLISALKKVARLDTDGQKVEGIPKKDHTPIPLNDHTILKKKKSKEESVLNTGISQKKSDRSIKNYPKDWYNHCIKKYQELKGIKLYSNEFKPVQQALKTMFLCDRKPPEIIKCMKFMSEDEFYRPIWTINTVKNKLAEFLAGKLGEAPAEVIYKAPDGTTFNNRSDWQDYINKIRK